MKEMRKAACIVLLGVLLLALSGIVLAEDSDGGTVMLYATVQPHVEIQILAESISVEVQNGTETPETTENRLLNIKWNAPIDISVEAGNFEDDDLPEGALGYEMTFFKMLSTPDPDSDPDWLTNKTIVNGQKHNFEYKSKYPKNGKLTYGASAKAVITNDWFEVPAKDNYEAYVMFTIAATADY